MCNCGNKREALVASQQFNSSTGGGRWQDVNFEYTGSTALTVRGNVSGKIYRFAKKGAAVPVDHRDASALISVPFLKKLS
ncbi:MAG: hypothetical protein QM687_04390 [Ferruginibacter sp.]